MDDCVTQIRIQKTVEATFCVHHDRSAPEEKVEEEALLMAEEDMFDGYDRTNNYRITHKWDTLRQKRANPNTT